MLDITYNGASSSFEVDELSYSSPFEIGSLFLSPGGTRVCLLVPARQIEGAPRAFVACSVGHSTVDTVINAIPEIDARWNISKGDLAALALGAALAGERWHNANIARLIDLLGERLYDAANPVRIVEPLPEAGAPEGYPLTYTFAKTAGAGL